MANCPPYKSRLLPSENIFCCDPFAETPPTGMANPRTPEIPKCFTTETRTIFGRFEYDVPKYRIFPKIALDAAGVLNVEDLIE
jgi:hypothetical protein